MTKRRMRAYREIKRERDHLAGLIGELEVLIYGPKGVTLSLTPKGGPMQGSALEEAVVRLTDLRSQYARKVEELTAELAEIERAIEPLRPRERQLIRLYYIEGMTWEEVAVVMRYSWRQIHRIHGDALRDLEATE